MYHRQCIINSGAFRPRVLLFYKHAYLHIPLIMYFTCIIRGSSLIKLGSLQDNRNYIAEIKNFWDIMVLVWTPLPHPPPPLPHPKACVSRNCDTNARIKFIYDIAIDDLEWKTPIDFGENRKTKMDIL